MQDKKRKEKRFIRRLESDFFFKDRKFKGISSDLSEHGLFVRTRNCLTVGSYVDVVIYLTDGRAARVSGTVRRAVRTNSQLVKNGMGIELTAFDGNYADVIMKVTGRDVSGSPLLRRDSWADHGARIDAPPDAATETEELRIIRCPFCGVKNKIPVTKLSMGPKCGRCREKLN